VTAFKQQRLKAWQPILTPKTVLPTFFVVGLLFLPLGIGLLVTSQQVQEIVLDYTNCDIDGAALPTNVKSWSFDNGTQTCSLSFDIATTFSGPVYMYYRLTNFYQNHRRYVKSFSATQLQGLVMDTKISLPLCTYNFIFFFLFMSIADGYLHPQHRLRSSINTHDRQQHCCHSYLPLRSHCQLCVQRYARLS